jgi:hypothetical protein
MSTTLHTTHVWQRITRAAKASPSKAHAAVAYFGSGAARLLPLKKGSTLVADMSVAAVKAGQTNPSEILALIEAGVAVYSRDDLHAKVFVLGKRAFIGSANASQNSAKHLVEAVVETADPRLVSAARRFVEGECHRPVTAEYARQMEHYYRPTKFGGGKERRKSADALRVVNLIPATYSAKEERINQGGLEAAAKKLAHPRISIVDYFRWSRKGAFKRHELVMQILKENERRIWVSPPGNIVDIKRYTVGGKQREFVYVEVRKDLRRRRLGAIKRRLGNKAAQRLRRGGMVGDSNLRRRLFNMWAGKS